MFYLKPSYIIMKKLLFLIPLFAFAGDCLDTIRDNPWFDVHGGTPCNAPGKVLLHQSLFGEGVPAITL